jgi:hypothetical protein
VCAGQQAGAYLLCHAQGQGAVLGAHRTVKHKDQQGELCNASLTANIQNSRYQEETYHPSRVAFELIGHHGPPGSPHTYWRFGDTDSMSAWDIFDPPLNARYLSSRRFPKSQNINQSLMLVGASMYEG